jgi:hypothetical protein
MVVVSSAPMAGLPLIKEATADIRGVVVVRYLVADDPGVRRVVPSGRRLIPGTGDVGHPGIETSTT